MTLQAFLAVSGPTRSIGEVLGPHGWVVVISLVVSAAATPLARLVALRFGIVDNPDAFLKPHGRPVPYMGGVAIYLGWLAGMLTLAVRVPAVRGWTAGLALAGGVIMLVGLADDRWDVKPKLKLLGQALPGVILLAFGIGTSIVPHPLKSSWPAWLVLASSIFATMVLVMAASNAANLLDGLDGLCSGVTGVISLCFLALATHLAMSSDLAGQDFLVVQIVASLAMAGAVCGFLPYNSNPAKIFMGDAGSMLLGLYVAAMILMFGQMGKARWVLGALMIFGLPILDTSLAMLRRMRLGRSIFVGDRSHLYDQLVDRGFSVRQTVALCYGLAAFYGIVGLTIIVVRTRYALIFYPVVAAITLYLCHRLGFLKPPIETDAERVEPDKSKTP